jgi:hypothetical protein
LPSAAQLAVQKQPPKASLPQLSTQEVGPPCETLVTHCPAVQVWLEAQLPQLPPQPSSPQTARSQARGVGLQRVPHTPARQTLSPASAAQLPHEPPQPSSPQTLPAQSGVQTAQLPAAVQTGCVPGQPITFRRGFWQSGSGAPQLQ